MGARFDEDDEIRSLEGNYMEESKRLLLADLENICIENVQTCILIANLFAAHLNPSSEALFFRIGVNLLQIMEAGSCTAAMTLIDREVRRRAWWTLYMADRWSSSSLGLPPQIRDTDLAVDLPMNETVFESLSPDETKLNVPWQPGLWAHKISLVRLFGPIKDLNHRSVYGNITAGEIESSVASLSDMLEEWERTIPQDVRMSAENLQHHIEVGQGGAFIALHLGYHHYATLLYFRFLEPAASLSPFAAIYRTRCKYHASSYSNLVRLARQSKNCEVIYPTVGHMAVVSSSVILHTLLFSEDENLENARDALKANFEAILELRRYWPNTESMVRTPGLGIPPRETDCCQIHRLVTFQNFCLLSNDYRTHKLDGWMLRFLIQYSLPLGEKDVVPVTSGMDIDMENFSARTQAVTEQGRYTAFEIENFMLSDVDEGEVNGMVIN
ncbi:Ff.00g039730.m01.CDS01 [Fusarium sp. VM40]|nr:Ff.00g039730.m01.CDS01 [Fusarium sp. VM40]